MNYDIKASKINVTVWCQESFNTHMYKFTFLPFLNKPGVEIHLYINPADLELTITEIMNWTVRSELLYHIISLQIDHGAFVLPPQGS